MPCRFSGHHMPLGKLHLPHLAWLLGLSLVGFKLEGVPTSTMPRPMSTSWPWMPTSTPLPMTQAGGVHTSTPCPMTAGMSQVGGVHTSTCPMIAGRPQVGGVHASTPCPMVAGVPTSAALPMPQVGGVHASTPCPMPAGVPTSTPLPMTQVGGVHTSTCPMTNGVATATPLPMPQVGGMPASSQAGAPKTQVTDVKTKAKPGRKKRKAEGLASKPRVASTPMTVGHASTPMHMPQQVGSTSSVPMPPMSSALVAMDQQVGGNASTSGPTSKPMPHVASKPVGPTSTPLPMSEAGAIHSATPVGPTTPLPMSEGAAIASTHVGGPSAPMVANIVPYYRPLPTGQHAISKTKKLNEDNLCEGVVVTIT